MKKLIALFLLLTFSVADITIERYGSSVIAYHDRYSHPIIFSSDTTGNMTSFATHSRHSEEDLPMTLHASTLMKSASAPESFLYTSQVATQSLLIAVLDTGTDLTNSNIELFLFVNQGEIPNNGIDDDMNGYIDDTQGYDFYNDDNLPQDDHGHGTLISGMAVRNSKGYARILPLKVFNHQGESSQFLIASAIDYAVKMGADIINCSFGYPYDTEILDLAVAYAHSQGVIIVASAGNYGAEEVLYPAGYDGVLAVSSIDQSDHLANFSNYGSHIALSCIGVDVLSTYLNDQYMRVSGTSISAAYISGLTAYIHQNMPETNINTALSQQTIDILDPLNTGYFMTGWDKYTGEGKLDIDSLTFGATSSGSSVSITSLLNYPNPIRNTSGTSFGYYLSANANVELYIYTLAGQQVWKKSIASGQSGGSSTYNKVSYDCRDESGNFLPNDTYILYVKAETDGNTSASRHLFTINR